MSLLWHVSLASNCNAFQQGQATAAPKLNEQDIQEPRHPRPQRHDTEQPVYTIQATAKTATKSLPKSSQQTQLSTRQQQLPVAGSNDMTYTAKPKTALHQTASRPVANNLRPSAQGQQGSRSRPSAAATALRGSKKSQLHGVTLKNGRYAWYLDYTVCLL